MYRHFVLLASIAIVIGAFAATIAAGSAATRAPRAVVEATPAAPVSTLEVDCDRVAPGVQPDCTLPSGAFEAAVDLVFVNRGSGPVEVTAFNFVLVTNQTILNPVPGEDQQLNANPDFADFADGAWACTPPASSPDTDPSPLIARSFLSCFHFNPAGAGPTVPVGSSLVLATVRYDVVAGGIATLATESVEVGNRLGIGVVNCYDNTSACPGGSIVSSGPPGATPTPAPPTPTPAPWIPPAPPVPLAWTDATLSAGTNAIAFDCAPAVSGVQSSCQYSDDTALIVVDALFWNADANTGVEAIALTILTMQTVLDPRPGHDLNLDANPDFGDLAGNWRCSPPAPAPDTNPSPDIAESQMFCNGAPGTGSVLAGTLVRLGTVYYDAQPGGAVVSARSAGVGGPVTVFTCGEGIGAVQRCMSAFIGVGQPAPQPTATATSSSTPTPTVTRTPSPTPAPLVTGPCISAGQRAALIEGVFRRFGARVGDRRYSVRYDVNRDGVISGLDAVAIATRPICDRGRR